MVSFIYVSYFVSFLFSYRVLCQHSMLKEGDRCMWKNVSGTCTNIVKCRKAKYDIISKRDYPPLCTLRGKIPVICCTDCIIQNDLDLRNEIFNQQLGTLYLTGSVANVKFTQYLHKYDFPCKLERKAIEKFRLVRTQNCYVRTERTSGDNKYEPTYPKNTELVHSVVLGYGEELETAQWSCAGSIISETFILTAANCTSRPDLGPVRHVVTNKLNNTQLPEPWRRYGVKRVIPHPQYRPHSKYHDIALIETDTPIVFNYEVAPVSLISEYDYAGNVVTWSNLGNGEGLEETLDSISRSVQYKWEDEECYSLFPPQPLLEHGYNYTIQHCYGFDGVPLDECEDDIGSSIVADDSTSCAYSILGVISIGRDCKAGDRSTLYTRVQPYVSWIESIVWPDLSHQRKHDNNTLVSGESTPATGS